MIKWCEEVLKEELLEYNLQMENICTLDRYDNYISEKVLSILLKWACYGQHISGITIGREKIAEIPKAWLKAHLIIVVKRDFDYSDYWNFARLLEVVVETLPELKDAILSLNSETTDQDLIDIINDYK
ncbi:MAG: hypothetical protein HFH06_14340 [Lachnospiraceae bacterium]|nr:hypothetical protein [Lachnospiraceae bacterium]